MSKKKSEETAMVTTDGNGVIIPDEIMQLVPDNSGGLFDNQEMMDAIQLEEGMSFRAPLVGRGPDMEFEKADGSGIDVVPTWKFQIDSTVVPIRGATHLDKQLKKVLSIYELPCMVSVAHRGQMELKGGKRMYVYNVGASGTPKSEPDVF